MARLSRLRISLVTAVSALKTASGALQAQSAVTTATATIIKTASGVLQAAASQTTGTAVDTPAGGALNNNRISAMHFQKHYEPTAMGI